MLQSRVFVSGLLIISAVACGGSVSRSLALGEVSAVAGLTGSELPVRGFRSFSRLPQPARPRRQGASLRGPARVHGRPRPAAQGRPHVALPRADRRVDRASRDRRVAARRGACERDRARDARPSGRAALAGAYRGDPVDHAHGAAQRPMSNSRQGRSRRPVISSLHDRIPKSRWVSRIVRRARLAGMKGPA